MKSFAVSMGIFCVLLGIIVWNYCYVSRVCTELIEKIEELPACDASSEAVNELCDYWKEESEWLAISLSLHTIHKMDDCLTELRYAADHNDTQFFEKNRYLARTIVEEMRDNEKPMLKNLI